MKYKKFFTLKTLFMSMSVIFSLLSLNAGFYLYNTFFGLTIALLFTVVLESLRLTSLYSINMFDVKYKLMSFVTYIIVAVICFTASVVSFNSRVIEKEKVRIQSLTTNVADDVFLIRKTYNNKIEKEIADIKLKLNVAENKNTAWQSKTYQRRIELYNDKINKLLLDRENYFKIKPTVEWINNQKAILKIKDVKGVYKGEGYSSIEQATIDFLKVDHVTFKKLLGLAMAIMIELGIIMLAFMAFRRKKEIKKEEPIFENEFETKTFGFKKKFKTNRLL